jgi:hypothetical protein
MSWRPDRSWWCFLLLSLLAGAGCRDGSSEPARKVEVTSIPMPPAPTADEGNKVLVGDNVFLQILPKDRRRVLISAEVCLRRGPLEMLLTRKGGKEHEAVLAANIDARKVHEALILAKAQPGSPVRFEPGFRPPTGTPIKVTLIYQKEGKQVAVPGQSWVRNIKTGKELESDWVFAGSILVEQPNPLDPSAAPKYMANDGDVICVANFPTALLDVGVESPKSWAERGLKEGSDSAERGYEAWTERIPDEGTKVVVALEKK